jgi:hypothetical protein
MRQLNSESSRNVHPRPSGCRRSSRCCCRYRTEPTRLAPSIRRCWKSTRVLPLTEQNPANSVYRYHLGLAYAAAGKDVLARQSLERALALKLPAADAADARKALASLK